MKVIRELNQSERGELKENHKHHYLFSTHIEVVLNKVHCYWVNMFASDYGTILIHSCLPTAGNSPYQYLLDTIAYIKTNWDFLTTSRPGCLSGVRVQHYLDDLTSYPSELRDCFMKLGVCFLLDKGETPDRMRNEITDGMHRLVAYGLVSDLNESHFPIPICFGTDKILPAVETG